MKGFFDIIEINKQIVKELKQHSYYKDIEKYVEEKIVNSIIGFINAQKHQKDKNIAKKFTKEGINDLNNNFPNWRNSRYHI